MSRQHNLPFERGQTLGGGIASAVTAGGFNKIVGQEFEVYDGMTPGTNHGTNSPIVLKVLQNLSDGNLNTGRGVALTTGASSFGKYAASYGATQGGPGILPIDDAYPDAYNIINNDAFYCVVEGPCHIKTTTGTVTTIAVNDEVTWSAAGFAEKVANDADDYVVGVSQTAATAAQTNTDLVVFVGRSNLA